MSSKSCNRKVKYITSKYNAFEGGDDVMEGYV